MKKRNTTKIITFISTLLISMSTAIVAFADTDPVAQVNNFEKHLASLIGAGGGIALLIGVIILAMGLAGHDPSQKMTGGIVMGAGAMLASAGYVVDHWLTASVVVILATKVDTIHTVLMPIINTVHLF